MSTRLLSPEQVAERLPSHNAESVRSMLRRGTLRGSRIGGRWYIAEDAIAELMEAHSNSVRRRRRRAS
jgi:hypothetical protein